MKKIATLLLLVLCSTHVFSQHYETLSVLQIQELPQEQRMFHYCISDDLLGVIIYGEPDCIPDWQEWGVNYQYLYGDSIVLYNDGTYHNYYVSFNGCESYFGFTVILDKFSGEESPFETPILWKRFGDTITLSVGEWSYHYFNHDITCTWSNGEQGYETTVVESGPYSITLKGACDSATYSVEVRDNVELYRATVDLETNLNKATWQVTPEQAEYISEVKVYRDGLLVGTVPYEQGYFLDAIGSDNAARNYRIVGVSVEGEDCPIESYQKGTIHTTYYEDVNGNLNMTWNVPYVEEGAQGTLTYFQICKYDPNTGDLTVVDQVNSSITDYTCGVNQFDGGHAVIAAVFSDAKGVEELSFSNLTMDILGIGENGESAFKIYPNPTTGRVTIEGTGRLTITNTLGQTVLTRDITDTETIDLPMGVWFVKLDETTRKVVVE